MPKSIWLEGKLLDAMYGNAAWPTIPATWYLALFTTAPTNITDSAIEPTIGAYARKSIVNNTTNFPAAAKSGSLPMAKYNGSVITFATATAGWGTIVGFGVFDTLIAGNLWHYGTVTPSSAVVTGTIFSVDFSNLILTET